MPAPHAHSSRADAIAAGRTTYFTGNPCRRGHVSARRTDSCACIECHRENARRRHAEILADRELLAAERARTREAYQLLSPRCPPKKARANITTWRKQVGR